MVYLNDYRQAEKSTLAQSLTAKHCPADYVTFDDETLLEAAETNPESF